MLHHHVHAFACLACSQYLGHMAFSFRTFGASLVSTVGTLRGDVSLDFTDYPRGVSAACVLLVVSLSWLFLVAMFGLILGVLTEQYRSVRKERQNAGRCGDVAVATLEPHDYQMIEFTMKRFKKWAGFTKPKPVCMSVSLAFFLYGLLSSDNHSFSL